MQRREFVRAAGVVAVAAGAPRAAESAGQPFKLLYAPHPGMFANLAGKDLLDQLKFMHDAGFRAFEDNGLPGREPALQEKIGATLRELGMTMGVFVAHAEWGSSMYADGGAENRARLQAVMKSAVEVARRSGARWCTVVPGKFNPKLEWDYQTANVIDALKAMCEVCEPAGLVMVLEPLNPWANHPGMFLSKIPQAYLICRAVGSPSCKILDDLYHQQITEGNLIPNLDRAWDEIAYFQCGDNPGRKEPTTGEINYKNIFRHLARKGYQGVIGMEHGLSQGGPEGERRLIAAYREVDAD